MDLAAQGRHLEVSITATSAQPALVPAWLAALQGRHIGAAVTGIAVDPAGAATFTVSFTVPWAFS
jgi:hypothetical protein